MFDEDSPLEVAVQTCKDWTKDTAAMLRQRAPQLTGAGAKSINGVVKKKDYVPYALRFRMERYLAWQDKGAGRGHGGTKGSSWTNKNGVLKRTNPESLGKMNKGNRHAQPFIEETIVEQLPVLADLLAQHLAESVVRYVVKRGGSAK